MQIISLYIIIFYFLNIDVVLSNPKTESIVVAQCQTSSTNWDGARHSCGDESYIYAPDGYVISDMNLPGGEITGSGSEHKCFLEFSDYIEVPQGTGIKKPRALLIRAIATGPTGHLSGRGWVSCRYTVTFTKINKNDGLK